MRVPMLRLSVSSMSTCPYIMSTRSLSNHTRADATCAQPPSEGGDKTPQNDGQLVHARMAIRMTISWGRISIRTNPQCISDVSVTRYPAVASTFSNITHQSGRFSERLLKGSVDQTVVFRSPFKQRSEGYHTYIP
jgi:hypothetical protein